MYTGYGPRPQRQQVQDEAGDVNKEPDPTGPWSLGKESGLNSEEAIDCVM